MTKFDPNVPATKPLGWFKRRRLRRWARATAERRAAVLALRVPTVRQRILLDTNVYDQLIGSGARLAHLIDLCNQGHLELLMTDVQHDQLEEARQRRHDMALAFLIPFTFTPTYGVVPGVSRANQARYGNRDLLRRLGADVDVPAPWPRPPEWDESRLLSLRKNGDALLAATAIYERAVFVTDDKQLTNRARAERAEMWSAADFIRHIDGLSLTAASGGVPGGAGPLDRAASATVCPSPPGHAGDILTVPRGV